MKRFIQGIDRTQGILLPEQLDDYVTEENPVRVVSKQFQSKPVNSS
jgi:transposase